MAIFQTANPPKAPLFVSEKPRELYLCTDSCPSLVFVLTDTFYLYSNAAPLEYSAKHTSAAREQLTTLTVSAL